MSDYTGSLVSFNYFSGSSVPRDNIFLNAEYIKDPFVNTNIIYRMKAYNTNLNAYVYWYIRQKPDPTGVYSGYSINHLTDIVVQHRRFI